jgi:hypothetical protein
MSSGMLDEISTRSAAQIVSVDRTPYDLVAYNLSVEEYHTYYVGEQGLWVHNTCSTDSIVYRALREGEDVTEGLSARSPGLDTRVNSHVMGKKSSNFISTTRSLEVATETFNSGNGVVSIDLNKVKGDILDLSSGIGGGRVYSRTKGHQEVLIRDNGNGPAIPPSAIRVIE